MRLLSGRLWLVSAILPLQDKNGIWTNSQSKRMERRCKSICGATQPELSICDQMAIPGLNSPIDAVKKATYDISFFKSVYRTLKLSSFKTSQPIPHVKMSLLRSSTFNRQRLSNFTHFIPKWTLSCRQSKKTDISSVHR